MLLVDAETGEIKLMNDGRGWTSQVDARKGKFSSWMLGMVRC